MIFISQQTETKTHTSFYCNTDTVFYKNKAQAKKETGGIVNRTKSQERITKMTPRNLSDLITRGYSFTAAALKGTKEEDFISQQLAVVDIDNERRDIPPTTVGDAVAVLDGHGIEYSFIYYSFSHSAARPKFRIVCVLSEYITDPAQAKNLNLYFISLFPQADQSCHNLDRFYYGTDKGLATEVYDRTTQISPPANPNPVVGDDAPVVPPVKTENTNIKSETKFDLTLAIKQFDLLSYIESTTGTQGRKKGKDYLFNPCPVCGHQDDFYVDTEKNVYKCHSASNGSGGNIINYLMNRQGLERKAAREHFIYDIMKQDRPQKRKSPVKIPAGIAPKDNALAARLAELQPHKKYYWNDLGTSRLYAELNHARFRYNYTAGAWYLFDGAKWTEDTGSVEALKQFEDLYDALLNYAVGIADMTQKRDYFEYILKLGKASERKRVLEDAENLCAVFKDDFDRNDDLLNCRNGTLNLKTLEFTAHDPQELLTKTSAVYYDPAAKSPLFEKFISEIMQDDAEKINYLQKALGYGLTTDTRHETCFILYGASTRNGKSTLMSAVMQILGGYALDMKPETLALKKIADTRQASGDLARLDGCRFLNASEPPKRMIFDAALLKNMLGRDPITARNLYEREFTFRPKFKLFINTNFLPLVTDDTLFKSGRINVITFDRHFTEAEQDTALKDKLASRANRSGIFNWLLEGLRKYRDEGLTPPEAVRGATDEYRRDSDKIGKFISECLVKTPGENCKAGEVYFVYEKWCDLNGYGCENKGNFFAELKNKNIFSSQFYIDGKTVKNVVRGYVIEEYLQEQNG